MSDIPEATVEDFERAVLRIPIKSRDQWLANRSPDVTASQAAALLGVHPYISAYELWAQKSGLIKADAEQTEAMDRGTELEPVAVRRLARIKPEWKVWQPNTYYSRPAKRMGATPDCFAIDPERDGFGVIQIKSVEPSVFNRTWKHDGTIEPPLWINIQALIEAELTGASWAAVAALVIGHGIELHLIPLDLHPGLIKRLEGEVAEFWQRVANHHPYDPNPETDFDILAALYDPTPGSVIDLTADNELPGLAEEDERLRKEQKVIKERREVLKTKFLLALGQAEIGRLSNGLTIIAKRVKRAGYEVKPTEFVQVTVKPPKGS